MYSVHTKLLYFARRGELVVSNYQVGTFNRTDVALSKLITFHRKNEIYSSVRSDYEIMFECKLNKFDVQYICVLTSMLKHVFILY